MDRKSKWLKRAILMDVKHYSKYGNIFIEDAECKISRNMKDVLVLNSPRESFHLHMGFRNSVITNEKKKGMEDKSRVLTKERFEKRKI